MRILYLSCHAVLEYDELKILRELSEYIFSPGAYLNPEGDGMRPSLPLVYDEDDVEVFRKLPGDGKDRLPKILVDKFDVVIVMHEPRWIIQNWENIKHKVVIWRTIGQANPDHEKLLAPYRKEGLKIVRYSPKEEKVAHYLGKDAVIRFGKDPSEFYPWIGSELKVMNITQSMKLRARECGWQIFNSVTEGFDRELYGTGNEGVADFSKGKVSYEELKAALRTRRVYFYTGTQPAPYTLNFMEAWLAGIPIVAVGPYHGNGFRYKPDCVGAPDTEGVYEVPYLLDHGVTGYYSDHVTELRGYIQHLFADYEAAKTMSKKGREQAIKIFGSAKIRKDWKRLFENLELL